MSRAAEHYHWSAIGHQDLPAWTELVNHLADVDRTDEVYTAADLAERLRPGGIDPQRDTWAVWAGKQMVAFGQVSLTSSPDTSGRLRATLLGGVHAEHRGRGLGRVLLDAMETRASAVATQQDPGLGHFWRVSAGREGSSAESLLRHCGYQLVRYFNVLTRELPGPPIAAPPAAQGVTIRPAVATDEQAVLATHRAAFADHWGLTRMSDQRWYELWRMRSTLLPASTVAVAGDGEVLSYVLASQWVPGELYLRLVGTAPKARGRGMARAAMAHTISRAAAGGQHEVVELEMDSANASGAGQLYTGLGFTLKFTTTTWEREPGSGRQTGQADPRH